MAYIPSPPPVMDFVQNGAFGPGFPKNGKFPTWSKDGTPGLTTKGTNQLGEPGLLGGPNFPGTVAPSNGPYTPPPNAGSTITDAVTGSTGILGLWDPITGQGITQATVAAMQQNPTSVVGIGTLVGQYFLKLVNGG
jgi:hypothetical protein